MMHLQETPRLRKVRTDLPQGGSNLPQGWLAEHSDEQPESGLLPWRCSAWEERTSQGLLILIMIYFYFYCRRMVTLSDQIPQST